LAKSERVTASIEEVFADDPEFLADLKSVRDAACEAAHFIKKLRGTAGLTQRQLAARLGISQPRVSAMEKGVGPEGPSYLMLQRVANACGVAWSLETGLGSAPEYGRLDVGYALWPEAAAQQRPRRGSNARLVEEVLQSNAPRALRPTEIRSAIQRDKGVAMAFTSIRHALGQLESSDAVEQITDRKTWRYRATRSGSFSARRGQPN